MNFSIEVIIAYTPPTHTLPRKGGGKEKIEILFGKSFKPVL